MDSVINGTATVQCYVVTLSYVSVCVKMRFFFFLAFVLWCIVLTSSVCFVYDRVCVYIHTRLRSLMSFGMKQVLCFALVCVLVYGCKNTNRGNLRRHQPQPITAHVLQNVHLYQTVNERMNESLWA